MTKTDLNSLTVVDTKREPVVRICHRCNGRGILNYQRATDKIKNGSAIDQSVGPCPTCKYKGYWVV